MSFCICICASMLAAGVIVSVDASPNDTGNGRRAKADHLKKNILKKLCDCAKRDKAECSKCVKNLVSELEMLAIKYRGYWWQYQKYRLLKIGRVLGLSSLPIHNFLPYICEILTNNGNDDAANVLKEKRKKKLFCG